MQNSQAAADSTKGQFCGMLAGALFLKIVLLGCAITIPGWRDRLSPRDLGCKS